MIPYRRHASWRTLAAALLLSAAPGMAQEWAGGGRADGLVLGPALEPVVGASVLLERSGGQGPPPALTDAGGRWARAGLAVGRWQIRVEAEGYIAAEGFLEVGSAPPPLEVRLRSVDEVPPSAFGDPAVVVGWLQRGNALLESGSAGEARAQYERALPLVPPAERPQVLRAIARSHWLEEDYSATLEALERAAAAGPEDATTPELLAAVLAALGRQEDLDAVLERAREAAAALAAGAPGQAPMLSPEPGRAGRYRTRFVTASPLSGIDTYLLRAGLSRAQVEAVDGDGGRYDPAAESFEVYVPDGEPPERGWGLVVWISPTPYGGFSRPEMREVLGERRLIWCGANRSGNQRHSWYRAALALDAAHHLRELYPVDQQRVYAAGYSGGGRVASTLALLYPEAFRGGLFVMGVNFYRAIAVPDRPGASWAPRFPRPPAGSFNQLKRDSRLVLLTGELDFNRAETRRVYEELVADGFAGAAYLEVPGASHYHPLDRAWLERAFDALDRRAPPAGAS